MYIFWFFKKTIIAWAKRMNERAQDMNSVNDACNVNDCNVNDLRRSKENHFIFIQSSLAYVGVYVCVSFSHNSNRCLSYTYINSPHVSCTKNPPITWRYCNIVTQKSHKPIHSRILDCETSLLHKFYHNFHVIL